MATATNTFVRRRTEGLLCIFALAFLVLAGRLIFVQLLSRGYYQGLADRFHRRPVLDHASRGIIFDRAGREMATNIPTKSIYLDITLVKDQKAIAERLASLLQLDSAEVFARINRASRSFLERRARNPKYKPPLLRIKRNIDFELGEKIDEMDIRGVAVFPEVKRYYPNGRTAAHLLGFTNAEGIGQEGIEGSFERILHGEDGRIEAEVDGKQQIISETRIIKKAKRDGGSVTLTIDENIQYIVETELEKAYKKHQAAGASAIVLDPKTGEILAMANMPIFDPNKPADSKIADPVERAKVEGASRRNRAIMDLYEPGSTLKLIPMAAALEEGIDTRATCTGSLQIGRRRINCATHGGPPHGTGDYSHLLCISSNVGTATVGLRLGKEKLYKYERAFGLTDKPGTGLPGEQRGILSLPFRWSEIQTANIAFGQGISVTPLQLASAYAAIANGGVLMRPQIIREVRDSEGKRVRAFKPVRVRRVVSKENARKLTAALESVVMDGTGNPAKIAEYRVAGKTGTAQKPIPGIGYTHGVFVGSFVGFVPAEHPRVVILVAVDEPKGGYYGSTVAGPVFREVARQLMLALDVPPDDPNDQTDGAKPGSFREYKAAKHATAQSLARD